MYRFGSFIGSVLSNVFHNAGRIVIKIELII